MSEQDRGALSPLERVLRVFTDVRAGEGASALLMALNIFLLLSAYYIIKPVREGLILAMDSGAQYKSYMGAAIAVALLVAVPAYATFARRLARNKLVVGVTLFFVSHIVIFYVLGQIESVEKHLGLWFFLWVGIFNMMVVAQFWAFAADIYDEDQGKRLFPLVAIGQAAGAMLGSGAANKLIPVFGLYQMLLVSGGLLAVCAFLTQVVHVRESKRPAKPRAVAAAPASGAAGGEKKKASASGSFSMVFRYRYLILLAFFHLLFTFVNTNGEFILGSIVSDAASKMVEEGTLSAGEKKSWIGAWFGGFFFYVNLLTFVLQSFVLSRVVKIGGVKLALFVYPLAALLGAGAIALLPILLVARIAKTVENGVDYSFNNTVRQMLWLPTTKPMKYQAKMAIDSFFVRMGDVASGALVAVLAGLLALGPRAFALVNVGLAVVTTLVAASILREQKHLKAMKDRGELPDDEPDAETRAA